MENRITKESILSIMDDYLNRIKIASGACDNDENLRAYAPVLDTLNGFVEEVRADLFADVVPPHFCNVVKELVEAQGLAHLPINANPHIIVNPYGKISTYTVFDLVSAVKISFEAIGSYYFYKALGFASRNTVLVGANGCGKTSLAGVLTKTLKQDQGIVIPAQKLLIIPTFDSVPSFENTFREYDGYQKDVLSNKETFNASDSPYSIVQRYGAEYKFVLSALFAERSAIRHKYCDKVQSNVTVISSELNSIMDSVIEIWNFLFEDRELKCDDSNNLVITVGQETYPAHTMSDGERVVLYLIGRVLLAPEGALIIVDEPELYLHKTIADKLWNSMELMRKNCIFIYLTHDLTFAVSRNAQKCWIKSYTHPGKWDIEVIQENEIPEELLLKLLGSKKKILFCEGKKNSLDVHVLETLFSNYTITPVQSCKDVIDYTRAFNKIKNATSKAYGIIDRDFRDQDELDKLEREQIYSYGVAEIENLFLVEDFIKGFAEYKREECNIVAIKEQIIAKLDKEKQAQASHYVANKINQYFKESHMSRGNTKEEVEMHYADFLNKVDVAFWHRERLVFLSEIVEQKGYQQAILVYNNKGAHSIVENALKLKDYRSKALDYLRYDSKIREVLRRLFPAELTA